MSARRSGSRSKSLGFRRIVPTVIRRTLFLIARRAEPRCARSPRVRAPSRRPSELRRHLELRHRHATRTPRAVEGQSLLHARGSRGVGAPGRATAIRSLRPRPPRRAPAPAPTTRSSASSAPASSRRSAPRSSPTLPMAAFPRSRPRLPTSSAAVSRDEESLRAPRIRVFRISVWRSSPPGRRCFRIPTTATTRSCRPGMHSSCTRR